MNYEPCSDLFLSQVTIDRRISEILDDCPDLDGGGFYAQRTQPGMFMLADDGKALDAADKPSEYAGWRTQMDPAAAARLRGFREGVEHVRNVIIGGGGGATVVGLLHLEEPQEILHSLGFDIHPDMPEEAVSAKGRVNVAALSPKKKTLTADETVQWALKIIKAAHLAGGQSYAANKVSESDG